MKTFLFAVILAVASLCLPPKAMMPTGASWALPRLR